MKDLGMRLGDERFRVQGGLGFMGSWARAGWEDEQEEGSEKEGEWEKTNRRRRLAVWLRGLYLTAGVPDLHHLRSS